MKKTYPDYLMKIERFKTKIKFILICNNLSKNSFFKLENGDYQYKASYTYKDAQMECSLVVFKDEIGTLFSSEKIPNVRFMGNINNLGIEFTLNANRHDEYMGWPYAKIPNILKCHQQYASNTGKCDISLEFGKKLYATIMNYRDKSLS